MADQRNDIVADGSSYALVCSDGGPDDAVLSETLVALAEQIARALDCFECCIYEYLPEREALRAQAIWSRRLTQRDREWIGEVHALDEIPDFARVVGRREVLVAYPYDDVDAATSSFDSMAYWGELAAIRAPISF